MICLTACQTTKTQKLIFPEQTYQKVQWTEKEKSLPIAIRHLYRNEAVSTHLIRLQGNETPHYHDHHDLSVTALSGQSTIHFKDKQIALKPGDVVFIPRGTYHWAENHDINGSVVFAVFSPAYQGKDKREANLEK